MSITRREICSLMAVLSAAILPANAWDAGSDGSSSLPSSVYPFEKLPVRVAENKAEFRAIFKGKLATGESIEVHETTLPPGGAPHPPHHHKHSEMWLIREGTVEFTVNGASQRAGPGSVAFAASNDEHGIRNSGETPATYFVVAMGPGAA
jgi:mannose-6-phosphate isomerase-like protein (cupin superfamily)